MAGLLREELAQQNMNRDRASTAAPDIPESRTDDFTVPPQGCAQPSANPARTDPVKNEDFDPGWDFPERRKFRYRVEDTAY